MRFSTTAVLALPALALAEQQIPLLEKVKGFFNQATASVASVIPSAPSVPSAPVAAAAAKACRQRTGEVGCGATCTRHADTRERPDRRATG